MNVNEITATAEAARERYEATRDRGHLALPALTAARAGLVAATEAQRAATAALDRLADNHVTGSPADPETVSAAVLGVEDAGRAVTWAEAVLAAAQRSLANLKAALIEAEREAVDTAETARKASLHSKVLALAGQA